MSYDNLGNLELYIPYDNLETFQEEGSIKTWDVYVNFFANATLSTIKHPSPLSEGIFEGVMKPIFWNKFKDYNPERNQIVIEYIKPNFSPEELATAKKLGSTIGLASKISGQTSEALASTALIFGLDPTGAVYKLSQLIKIVDHVKYIGCNFGKMFGSFLSGYSQGFEISKEEKDSNIRLALENDFKLSHDEIPILLFRKSNILNMLK